MRSALCLSGHGQRMMGGDDLSEVVVVGGRRGGGRVEACSEQRQGAEWQGRQGST